MKAKWEAAQMEAWRKVWRRGIAPQFSAETLEELRTALREDDPRLLQGATCVPPPLLGCMHFPLEGACVLAFIGLSSEPFVREAEEQFAKVCFEADCTLQEPAAVRYFLNWYDDTPRDQMRRELLAEVDRELAGRLDVCDSA